MCMYRLKYLKCVLLSSYLFFSKQKTAYEVRISDWSSDVCYSNLARSVAELLFDFDAVDRRPARHHVDGAAGGVAAVQRALRAAQHRSEERREGKECVSTCRSRRSPSPEIKK